jgi:pyrimidine operon attenuation protein/uracil phosphoribosyltransferase
MVLADRENRELPIAADFVGGQVDIPDHQILVLEKDDAGQFSFQLEERAQ